MGAEEFDGVIEASTPEEAIKEYKNIAPTAYYDLMAYSIMETIVFPDVFPSESSAHQFLRGKMKKWDMKAGIVRCGEDRFAWLVIMPI
jgi:hypothetical protein